MASRPSASQLQQGGATGHQQSQALLELTSVIPLPGSGFGCVVFCKSASYIYSHALHTTTRPTHIHTPYTHPHTLHTSTRPIHNHTHPHKSLNTNTHPTHNRTPQHTHACTHTRTRARAHTQAGKRRDLGSNPIRFCFLFKSCGLWTLSCDFVLQN